MKLNITKIGNKGPVLLNVNMESTNSLMNKYGFNLEEAQQIKMFVHENKADHIYVEKVESKEELLADFAERLKKEFEQLRPIFKNSSTDALDMINEIFVKFDIDKKPNKESN